VFTEATMNKFILTLSVAAFAASTLTLTAQDKPKGEGRAGGGQRFSPEERLKRMTEMLSLTQEQQDKVKAIMEEGRTKFAALREAPEAERREKGQALMKEQTEQIGAVLTPEQKTKWEAEMAKRRAEGGGQRPEGRRGDGDKKPEEKKSEEKK
jgi:periplasmic protein CpxP/Spy